MNKIKKFFSISFIKTIILNVHYFGLKAIFYPYILIAKNVQIKAMKGKINIENKKIGCIKIGFQSIGIENDSICKGTIEINGVLTVKKSLNLGRGASLSIGKNGCMEIDSLLVNGNTKIVCNKSILFGENCLISWGEDISWIQIFIIYIIIRKLLMKMKILL